MVAKFIIYLIDNLVESLLQKFYKSINLFDITYGLKVIFQFDAFSVSWHFIIFKKIFQSKMLISSVFIFLYHYGKTRR